MPDPFEIHIPKDEFSDIILQHPYLQSRGLAKSAMVVKQLVKVFLEHRQALDGVMRDDINLGDVEDNSLGYM